MIIGHIIIIIIIVVDVAVVLAPYLLNFATICQNLSGK